MCGRTFQPAVRESRESSAGELVMMRWGLIPHFVKSLAEVKGVSTINARAESIEKSPTWRLPFERRRCLVPAHGFYERKKLDGKERQPYSLMIADEAPFAFAGLWDAWCHQHLVAAPPEELLPSIVRRFRLAAQQVKQLKLS